MSAAVEGMNGEKLVVDTYPVRALPEARCGRARAHRLDLGAVDPVDHGPAHGEGDDKDVDEGDNRPTPRCCCRRVSRVERPDEQHRSRDHDAATDHRCAAAPCVGRTRGPRVLISTQRDERGGSDSQLSVKIWVMIVQAMLSSPDTPDARNADVVDDSPAWENRTGAYSTHVSTSATASRS